MTAQYFLPGKALTHCKQVTSHFSCWQAKQMEPSISPWKAFCPCHFFVFSSLSNFSSVFSEWGLPTIPILYTKCKIHPSPAYFIPLKPPASSQGHTRHFCLFAAGLQRELRLLWRQRVNRSIQEAWLWSGTWQQPWAPLVVVLSTAHPVLQTYSVPWHSHRTHVLLDLQHQLRSQTPPSS